MCFDSALLTATSLSIEWDSVKVLELRRVLLHVNRGLRLNPNRGHLEPLSGNISSHWWRLCRSGIGFLLIEIGIGFRNSGSSRRWSSRLEPLSRWWWWCVHKFGRIRLLLLCRRRSVCGVDGQECQAASLICRRRKSI